MSTEEEDDDEFDVLLTVIISFIDGGLAKDGVGLQDQLRFRTSDRVDAATLDGMLHAGGLDRREAPA